MRPVLRGREPPSRCCDAPDDDLSSQLLLQATTPSSASPDLQPILGERPIESIHKCRSASDGLQHLHQGAGATDYAMKLMQNARVDGMANVLLRYTGSPIFVSSGTYKGQSMRENGVISVITP